MEPVTLQLGNQPLKLSPVALARAIIETADGVKDVAAPSSSVPRIGEYWKGQGGIYAGVCTSKDGDVGDGSNDHYLIVADPDHDDIKWKDAVAWAAGLEIDGHKDFTLPSRKEQPVLFGNVGSLFKETYYWSRTQRASTAEYAWIQGFGYGGQDDSRKSYECRARAVRRIPIR